MKNEDKRIKQVEEIEKDTIAAHWDGRSRDPRPSPINWWESRLLRRLVNRRVHRKPSDEASGGLVKLAKERLDGRVLERGISVGCGIASKELRLIRSCIVRHFDLFELSEVRIEKGRALSHKMGFAGRVRFFQEDAFSFANQEDSYDLVHWNNSLHHMMDVESAVKWSRRVLRPGGMFLLDDFVGPTRWQWSDKALDLVSRVRAALPERYRSNPFYPTISPDPLLPSKVQRPSARRIEKEDPSEAADSESILPSVRKHFPEAFIQLTGGVIYHFALSKLIHNFDENDEDDRALLEILMVLDEVCTEVPELESHYAIAIAFK